MGSTDAKLFLFVFVLFLFLGLPQVYTLWLNRCCRIGGRRGKGMTACSTARLRLVNPAEMELSINMREYSLLLLLPTYLTYTVYR
ncbi:hypothetical protein F5X96DRAFT_657948 [Biscogniauxia mediterranea]|nr:hypothetical protein F5X96DRAFT_657948 [Biscogniauxia mediterranea]